jgi:hypothetical protein
MEINRDRFGLPLPVEQEKGILFLYQARLLFKPALMYCLWRGIRNAADVVAQLDPEQREASLQGCDEETRINLLRLYRKFSRYPLKNRPRHGSSWKVKVVDYLPEEQQKILMDNVTSWIMELSGWTLKGLIGAIEISEKHSLIDCILDTSVDYERIRQIGGKSASELKELQHKTIKLLHILVSSEQ